MKLTRREFAVTAVAAGYALAVRPAAAAAIHTDEDGLIAGPVMVPVADGQIPAYRAKPQGAGPFPVILVVHEIFDLHEFIQDICRRFAKLGYLAIAPSLYAREGDVSKITDIQEIIGKVVSKVPDEQVMTDLDSTAAFAFANGGDAQRLGLTGFCWGGRIAWLYAAHNPGLKAAVAWYGMVDKAPFAPSRVLDMVGDLKAPVLGLYGGQDTSIPLGSLEEMKQKLAALHSPDEIVIYPDAGHGFFADYRPSYDAKDAPDAWARCTGWFGKYLKA
jgi:carboxymethylenebutenolidase